MTGPMPPCPICKRPGIAPFRPFCSKRCADIDLGRWFTEHYTLPADPGEEDEKIVFPPLDRPHGLE